jgi:hypothetical protein
MEVGYEKESVPSIWCTDENTGLWERKAYKNHLRMPAETSD